MALLRSLTLSPVQKKKPRRSRLSTGGEIFLDGPEHGASEERKYDAECEEQKAEGMLVAMRYFGSCCLSFTGHKAALKILLN